jgi:hypothetical protein
MRIRERTGGATDKDWEFVGNTFHHCTRDNHARLQLGTGTQNIALSVPIFFFSRKGTSRVDVRDCRTGASLGGPSGRTWRPREVGVPNSGTQRIAVRPTAAHSMCRVRRQVKTNVKREGAASAATQQTLRPPAARIRYRAPGCSQSEAPWEAMRRSRPHARQRQ